MNKIKRYLLGGISLANPYNQQTNFTIKPPLIPYSYFTTTNTTPPDYSKLNKSSNNKNIGNLLKVAGIGAAGNILSGIASDKLFGDSETGRVLGTLFSSGVTASTDTLTNNLLKGDILSKGLSLNIGGSLAGSGAGIAANYIGLGITSAIGDTAVGRGVGAGVSSSLGIVGGTALLSVFSGSKILNGLKSINPIGATATVLGSALGAAAGPSKEYNGEYGNITQTADTAYDLATVAANALPGGQIISGAMALNKGLSNLFGSTDGMTIQDSILGSAWMPAPLKWINMWGSSKTGTFNNQSWQNTEKTNSFMENAFGNLLERFDRARKEAGKTYGTFSLGARREASDNINFSNSAYNKILSMTDLNEILNIRSQFMTSINNQRYAQDIQGGLNPLARGKYGMKILNNATNHNIGMRLLSGAALVDSKQMILCGAID